MHVCESHGGLWQNLQSGGAQEEGTCVILYINGYYYRSELNRLLIFASILVVEFAHNKALLTFVIKQYTLVIDSSGMLVGVWYCFA